MIYDVSTSHSPKVWLLTLDQIYDFAREWLKQKVQAKLPSQSLAVEMTARNAQEGEVFTNFAMVFMLFNTCLGIANAARGASKHPAAARRETP